MAGDKRCGALKKRPFPIRLHPAFIVLLAVFGFIYPQESCLILLSLLVHEGCHAAMALYYGIGVERLELLPCGGKLVLANQARLSGRRLLAVAAAGPLGSLLAAQLCCGHELLYQTNLMLCCFNLLPFLPLDGANICRALLCGRLGERRTCRLLAILSAAGSLLLMAAAAAAYLYSRTAELSVIIMALFIAGEARAAYKLARYQPEQQSWHKLFQLADSGYCSARLCLAERETRLLTVLKGGGSGCLVVFVVNDAQRVIRIFSEFELWQELERGGSQLRFGDLLK